MYRRQLTIIPAHRFVDTLKLTKKLSANSIESIVHYP